MRDFKRRFYGDVVDLCVANQLQIFGGVHAGVIAYRGVIRKGSNGNHPATLP
jgi:hypothetical protein